MPLAIVAQLLYLPAAMESTASASMSFLGGSLLLTGRMSERSLIGNFGSSNTGCYICSRHDLVRTDACSVIVDAGHDHQLICFRQFNKVCHAAADSLCRADDRVPEHV